MPNNGWMQSRTRHERVLIEPNPDVATALRDDPGEWYLVGEGSIERARVFSQTANRIRKGELDDFPKGKTSWFEATSTADQSRPDMVAPVELYARFCQREGRGE